MRNEQYVMLMFWDITFQKWSPLCVLASREEIIPLLDAWEKDFNAPALWHSAEEFSIGSMRYMVSFIYCYFPLDNKPLHW